MSIAITAVAVIGLLLALLGFRRLRARGAGRGGRSQLAYL